MVVEGGLQATVCGQTLKMVWEQDTQDVWVRRRGRASVRRARQIALKTMVYTSHTLTAHLTQTPFRKRKVTRLNKRQTCASCGLPSSPSRAATARYTVVHSTRQYSRRTRYKTPPKQEAALRKRAFREAKWREWLEARLAVLLSASTSLDRAATTDAIAPPMVE